MARQNLGIHVPRRTEQGIQFSETARIRTKKLRGYRIVLLADAQCRMKFAAEDLGIAVGRQAHDLRSIIVREAKMTAHHLPQEAERVRIIECFDGLDTRTNSLRQRRDGYLADPVDGEDGLALEG